MVLAGCECFSYYKELLSSQTSASLEKNIFSLIFNVMTMESLMRGEMPEKKSPEENDICTKLKNIYIFFRLLLRGLAKQKPSNTCLFSL